MKKVVKYYIGTSSQGRKYALWCEYEDGEQAYMNVLTYDYDISVANARRYLQTFRHEDLAQGVLFDVGHEIFD